MAKHSAFNLLLVALLLAMLAVAAAHGGGHHNRRRHQRRRWRPRRHHHYYHRPAQYCNWKGSVCHDPVLVGADGAQFYFHGHKDADFCLVSDTDLHINAHFIGRRREGLSRDFTWVQSLGILFGTNQLYVGANKVATWDDNVDQLTLGFNNAAVVLPEGEDAVWEAPDAGVSITRLTAKNSIAVDVDGQFRLLAKVVPITQAESLKQNYGIGPDNCFAHLEINLEFHSLTAGVSGVLGQTYAPQYQRLVKKPGQLMPTMGGDSQFLASGLMAPDCAVARFGTGTGSAAEILSNLVPVSCTSESTGAGGVGMVCRR